MKFESTIVVRGKTINIQALYKSLLAEQKSHKSDRSSYTMKKEKDNISFKIIAKDPVALRATLNSITKLLSVFKDILDTDKK